MRRESFIVTLFMFIAGIAFIIIGFNILVKNITTFMENSNLKKYGEQVSASITYRSKRDTSSKNSSHFEISKHYIIEYVIDGKKYSKQLTSTEKKHEIGDTITIYCMRDNPEKIYAPMENLYRVLTVLVVFPGLTIVGLFSIIKYNIFTYGRT